MKWILRFLFPAPLYFGGDGGDTSGAAQQQEEDRKARLRSKIDTIYGISPGGSRPAPISVSQIQDPEAPFANLNQAADDTAGQAYDADARTAADAKAQMESENTKLSDATRAYYTDALGRQYAKAERGTRFALARQGLLGGSADVDEQAEVKTDRNLGATRVDDAVRRAVAGLQTQREQERLNAVNLVNSGAGDSAVTAAQRGLENSFQTANTQQKADLFGDLFSSAADATAASNMQAQQAALAAQYRNRLATFFTPGTGSGQVTAGGR